MRYPTHVKPPLLLCCFCVMQLDLAGVKRGRNERRLDDAGKAMIDADRLELDAGKLRFFLHDAKSYSVSVARELRNRRVARAQRVAVRIAEVGEIEQILVREHVVGVQGGGASASRLPGS